MKVYEFLPVKNTKKLSGVIGVLFFGAAAIMAVTLIIGEVAYKWIPQLISLIMLGVGVFITTRYITKSYLYRIEENGEGADLVVIEIQGRRSLTVCRLSLGSIESVSVVGTNEKPKYKELVAQTRSRSIKRYDYCANMLECKRILLFANECGEEVFVMLTYDQRLFEILAPSED